MAFIQLTCGRCQHQFYRIETACAPAETPACPRCQATVVQRVVIPNPYGPSRCCRQS